MALGEQLIFPILYARGDFTLQQRGECLQRLPRIANQVIKRLPIVAVLAIVIRNHVLKSPRLLHLAIRAAGPLLNILQVLERQILFSAAVCAATTCAA